jgi:hypothetical protein
MTEATGNRRASMRATDKPFNIDKKLVYEAYKAVKSNKGAAGVDGQTIEQFEADLKSNLYKIWNRMSSGTYFLRRYAPSPFPRSLEAKGFWVCCVKKTRKRHAVRKMKVGPSEPSCRRRLQTAVSCCSQKLWW